MSSTPGKDLRTSEPRMTEHERDHRRRDEAPEILRRVGIRRGDRVVGFGGGLSRLVPPLARVVGTHGRVTVLERETAHRSDIERLLRDASYGSVVEVLDTDGLHFPEEASAAGTDVLLVLDMLEFVDAWSRFSRAARRLLRRNGLLLISPGATVPPESIEFEALLRALFTVGFRPLFRRRVRVSADTYERPACTGVICGFENAGTRLTPFRAAVLAAISLVPPGRVTTYARVSRHLSAGSALAVGQALKHNPFAPMAPCHRVIATDLRPGGFAGERVGPAVSRKLSLLAAEGVRFAGGRLVDRDRLWEFPALFPGRR